jgi:tRNA 5-methylaminomethyl-2-thiouridine biosynthesis bifunctional protein
VRLVDAAPAPLSGASGLPLGAFHPVVARDESRLARFTRAGFLWQAAHTSERARLACGHLDVALDAAAAALAAATMDDLAFPAAYARWVDASEASGLAGQSVAHGGVFYPEAGCIRPAAWASDIVERHRDLLTFTGSVEARRLDRINGRWQLGDGHGQVIGEASVVVIATGAGAVSSASQGSIGEGALCLGDEGSLGLKAERVRGQLTALTAQATQANRVAESESGCLRAPALAVGGDGHCLPAIDGQAWVGATYARENASLAPRSADDEANRARLGRLLPQAGAAQSPIVGCFVGFRAVAPDRMPLVGAVPDLDGLAADPAAWRGAHLADLPRLEGVFACTAMASRGLTWAGIAAETVASLIEGEPLPIESDLVDAIDPARRVLDALRRGAFARGR